MEPLLLCSCTTNLEEVLATEIVDADVFKLLPCKCQCILVADVLGIEIDMDLITAIVDSVQEVSIMLIQKSTFINCSHFVTEPNTDAD